MDISAWWNGLARAWNSQPHNVMHELHSLPWGWLVFYFSCRGCNNSLLLRFDKLFCSVSIIAYVFGKAGISFLRIATAWKAKKRITHGITLSIGGIHHLPKALPWSTVILVFQAVFYVRSIISGFIPEFTCQTLVYYIFIIKNFAICKKIIIFASSK